MNDLIARRMIMDVKEKMPSNRVKRQIENPNIAAIIFETCQALNEALTKSMTCNVETCDPKAKFRQISGCCNNLNRKLQGK